MKRYESARVIAFAPNRWDGPWMNRQQLLSRLGNQYQILYSNGLWTIWDRGSKEWHNTPLLGSFESHDSVCIDSVPKWLMRWPRWRRFDNAITRFCVKRWMKQLRKMGDGDLICYVFHPQYYPLVSEIKPDYLVYHAYDSYHLTPEWNEQLAQQEKDIANSADLVLASSEVTQKYLLEITNKRVVELPNGVDFNAFSLERSEVPADLDLIPQPRIGYTGNLNRKVDFELVAVLARRHSDWHFIFIGGIGSLDSHSQEWLSVCKDIPNVHFLGQKDYQLLPAYVSQMDVNIMCYRISADLWTAGIYPLKLHEYLATGKPVISADILSVRKFSEYLDIAHDPGEWETMIANAIIEKAPGNQEQRRNIAKKNDWNERAGQLDRYLKDMMSHDCQESSLYQSD